MATVKNISSSEIIIANTRVKPQGTIEISGVIPESLRVLERLNALEIDGEGDEKGGLVVKSVDNPKDPNVYQPSPEELAHTAEQRVIEVMRGLPADALMADGRPEVKAVNERLGKMGLNNITAADRDRLWETAQKQD